MANRYTNLSTSTYTPLSLDEIMVVPMAKQKQHDAAQQMADQYSALKANRLSQDADIVDSRLGQLRDQSDALSTQLMDQGVNRDLLAKFRGLKRDVEKEYSQEGLIGSAEANYRSATKFVNDLATEKVQQAGWSPQRAKQWAQGQVAAFEGTDDGIGGFRQFSGQGLATKVDRNKWIDDKLKNIAADSSPIAARAMQLGGLPAFQKAYQDGQIETKEYNKIMNSLSIQAQNDPDLMSSLQQESFFTGEQNATSIGEWKIKKNERTGKSEQVFVPTSSFGAQLTGAATGAQYKRTTLDYKIIKDFAGFELYKRGLDEEDSANYVSAANGELHTIKPESLDNLRNSIELAKGITSDLKNAIDNYKGDKNSRDYQELHSRYVDETTKQKNLQSQVDGATNVVMKKATDNEKKLLKIDELLSNNKHNIYEVANSLGIKGLIDPGDANSGYARMDSHSKIQANNAAYKAVLDHFGATGGASDIHGVRKSMNEKIHQEIQRNPTSYQLTLLGGDATGKYSSVTGGIQKRLSQNFNEDHYSAAYTGESLMGTKAALADEYPDAKIEANVIMTANTDSLGYPVESIVYTDSSTGQKLLEVSATRGEHGRPEQRDVAKELMKSDDAQKYNLGKHMFIDSSVMPMIKKANIYSGAKHSYIPGMSLKNKATGAVDQIGIEIGKSTIGTDTFYITKNGERISNKEYKSEREVADDLFKIMPK